MMRLAVFGINGQVGREIAAATANGVDLLAIDRQRADLMTPGAASTVINDWKPDAVVNAAAWTAVDKAETCIDAATRINADAAGEIAEACAATGARLVHISTDYVFDGAGSSALDESAPTRPLGVYGATKLAGEALVLSAHKGAVVLRTSWVYSLHGSNFVKTMLSLAQTREALNIVADQIGGPTPADAIARACLEIASRPNGPAGLYHFQGAPPASWADFAEEIFAAAGLSTRVGRIPTREYPTPARRPLFSVLNCEKIHKDYGISQPDWRRDIVRTAPALLKRLQEGA
jgi:dTDP-4-dehydrorhamnose reductase